MGENRIFFRKEARTQKKLNRTNPPKRDKKNKPKKKEEFRAK